VRASILLSKLWVKKKEERKEKKKTKKKKKKEKKKGREERNKKKNKKKKKKNFSLWQLTLLDLIANSCPSMPFAASLAKDPTKEARRSAGPRRLKENKSQGLEGPVRVG